MNSLQSVKQTLQNVTSRWVDRAIWLSLITIATLLLLWTGFHAIPHWTATTTTADVRNLIIGGLQNTSELTTVSSSGKATIVINQQKKVLGIPVGDTNLVYEGVGTIRAGIDLTKLEVTEVDMSQHKIHIVLPPPSLSDIGLDVGHSSTLAAYRRWLAPKVSPEMQEQAQRQAIAELKAQAQTNRILEAANSNAKQLIETVLTKAGFQTIEIETVQKPGF